MVRCLLGLLKSIRSLYYGVMNVMNKQESIPVACVPLAFLVPGRGVGQTLPCRQTLPSL